jgi:hypothetical protein
MVVQGHQPTHLPLIDKLREICRKTCPITGTYLYGNSIKSYFCDGGCRAHPSYLLKLGTEKAIRDANKKRHKALKQPR